MTFDFGTDVPEHVIVNKPMGKIGKTLAYGLPLVALIGAFYLHTLENKREDAQRAKTISLIDKVSSMSSNTFQVMQGLGFSNYAGTPIQLSNANDYRVEIVPKFNYSDQVRVELYPKGNAPVVAFYVTQKQLENCVSNLEYLKTNNASKSQDKK